MPRTLATTERSLARRFHGELGELRQLLLAGIAGIEGIDGIGGERDRHSYATILLFRLILLQALASRGFLAGGEPAFLERQLVASRREGADRYYRRVLRPLLGEILPPHRIENEHPDLEIPDATFAALLDLFLSYSWDLGTPGEDEGIDLDVLGQVFEMQAHEKELPAWTPPPAIARHLCERTIDPVLLARMNEREEGPGGKRFDSVPELLAGLDARLARRLLAEVLPSLSILDPACGSGAFLAAALARLTEIAAAAAARCETGTSRCQLAKRILTANLFGVDWSQEALEIARLRLDLSLVTWAANAEELLPLPDLDGHLFSGNALFGLPWVDETEFEHRQPGLFRRTWQQALDEKGRRSAREEGEVRAALDALLLDELRDIPCEQATWDRAKDQPGKPVKRPLAVADVAALRPFHWAYELAPVLGEGGFDVILTQPSWEPVKPQVQEFLAEVPEAFAGSGATERELEREPARLGKSRETREAWLAYLSRFPHQNSYYRTSPWYNHPIAVAEGRRGGTDLHLHELFLARSFRLLRPGGRCGMVLPTSFYADPGAKALRETLFSAARVETLLGLSNERLLLPGVETGFRLCLLVFARGGATEAFTAAFRVEPRDALTADRLEAFLAERGHPRWSWDLVRRLAPGSFTVPEDKRQIDLDILGKAFRFPALESEGPAGWSLRLVKEFDTTSDSYLFRGAPGPGRLPLWEGRMIQAFSAGASEGAMPRYWLEEEEARRGLLGRKADTGQRLDYQGYRLGFRDGARSADERTLVMTMLPPGVFCNDKLPTAVPRSADGRIDLPAALFLSAVANSFVADYLLRQRASASLTMAILSQLPVPRPSSEDRAFRSLVELAARLTCTTAEFADLWQTVTGTFWFAEQATTDPAERARLQAELDGRVAHLYGLTEAELAYVLTTFPRVPEEVRDAVLAAYRVGEGRAGPKQGNHGGLPLQAMHVGAPPGASPTSGKSAGAPPGDPRLSPAASEVPPDASEIPPGAPGIPPGTSEIPPRAREIPPGTWEIAPDTARTSPGASKIAPDASKVSPEASAGAESLPACVPEDF